MAWRRVLLGGILSAIVAVFAVACGDDEDWLGSEAVDTPTATATPDAADTPTASPTPDGATPASTPGATPTFPAGSTGAPFSATDLQTTWEAQGMEVTLGGPNPAFTGFGAEATVARLERGEDSMEVFYLVYADSDAVEGDWTLTVGEPPAAKEGRDVPDHITIWWNENVVVVVHTSVGAIGSDALDAFLALGEPAGSPTPPPSPTPSA
jgi:hypothetical protein